MRVAGLNADGDWRFGKGRAVYLRQSAAIRQNVLTRLRSFTDDWFADTAVGLPWLTMLGERNNEARVLREIERVVLTTEGVRTIDRLRIVQVIDRAAQIELTITDVYSTQSNEVLSLP
jgi:hypothetical protein